MIKNLIVKINSKARRARLDSTNNLGSDPEVAVFKIGRNR